MGGFGTPVTEPGPSITTGRIFYEIPQGGILTTLNDTLFGGAIIEGMVFGDAGTDLLVLDYSLLDGFVDVDLVFQTTTAFSADFTFLGLLHFREFEHFRITGSANDDRLSGALDAASILAGGAGNDSVTLRGAPGLVRGGQGNDTVIGATLNDTLAGGGGSDVLLVDLSAASAGVDLGAGFNAANWSGFEHFAGTLTAFDDTLRGGALTEFADGGAGVDLLVLDYGTPRALAAGTRVWFDDSGGYASVQFLDRRGGFAGALFIEDFEQYSITGTQRDDTLGGGARADLLEGGAGDDWIRGGGGADTLLGGDGNDRIESGHDGRSLVFGGDGNDAISVRRIDDTVDGGAGHDRLLVELWEADAGVTIDMTTASPGFAWQGIEVLSFELTNHDDTLRLFEVTGGLDGGGGMDLLALDYSRTDASALAYQYGRLSVASAGSAELLIHDVRSFERYDLTGSAGNDTMIGDMMADTLNGGRGNDRLDGDLGDDRLLGSGGNDCLADELGDDTMLGGNGRDTLVGGNGDDVLAGGAGRDTFYFWGPSIGNDVVIDFEAGIDRILIDPLFEMVPLEQSGADVLIEILGQLIRIENATTLEVANAIEYEYLLPG